MRLPVPFVKLPFVFDAEKLEAEIMAFSEADWRPHPQGFTGNSALILVSKDGGENDATSGSMAPTPHLHKSPYLRQVLASFHTVVGRSRLMRLDPGSEVSVHSDIDYYWHDRVRIHVPIITDPRVRFICDGVDIHMARGEAWIFDNWRPHRVINGSDIRRVHLVIDTAGTSAFWRLAARTNNHQIHESDGEAGEYIPFRQDMDKTVVAEKNAEELIAHPSTIKIMCHEILGELRSYPHHADYIQKLEAILIPLIQDWQSHWSLYGDTRSGWPQYLNILQRTLDVIRQIDTDVRLPSNGTRVTDVLMKYLTASISDKVRDSIGQTTISVPTLVYDRPIIILSAPRSGSSLLFEMLSRHPDLWTLGNESHAEIESIPALSPKERGFDSNSLTDRDADPDTQERLKSIFTQQLVNARGEIYARLPEPMRPTAVRFLEKTPKNILRIPFLSRVFPDALFLFLYREAKSNISSMIDAWRSERFVTYRNLPDWPGPPWSLLLIPGWQQLRNASLGEIATRQWLTANIAGLDALAQLPENRWRIIEYSRMVADPAGIFSAICKFSGLASSGVIENTLRRHLPLSRYTLTPPAPDKWQRNIEELEHVPARTQPIMERLSTLRNRL